MSLQLVSSVPNQNLNRAIVELERLDSDSRCADLHSSFRGPFGAFRLQTEVQTEDLTTCQNEIDLSTDDWFGQLEDLLGDLNTDQPHFTLDLADMTVSDSVNHELTNLHIPQNVGSNADEPRLMPDLSLHPSMGNIEGWCLISHYKDRIIPLISPWRRGQETPWMSLIIPCATTTLSELTLNETANHARLALLNAVWSTSAFHLANATTGCLEQWRAPAECYLKRARSHFQKCMEESCTSTVKMSKYKEILMAILSLSNVFVRDPRTIKLTRLTKI